MPVRFLHLADTHLGARHPDRGPGDPYVEAYRRALAPALRGEAALVLHAGDLYHRSRPSTRLVAEACGGLLDAAEAGAEVVLVAGNHERSVLPGRLLLGHPRIHVLEGPARLRLDLGGLEVAVFGFPFARRDVRGRFEALLRQTGWPVGRAEVDVLLAHLAVEGATVGPAEYTFRRGPDVVPRAWFPPDLHHAALGHIHRAQTLVHPRRPGLRLAYPGSTERTARAERFETKGHLVGEMVPGEVRNVRFVELPAREIDAARRVS